MRFSSRVPRLPIAEVLLGLLFFASACASIWLTRIPGGISQIWPPAAIAAATLIRMPRPRWGIIALLLSIGILCANVMVAHRPWNMALGFSCINLAEIASAVWLFRFAAWLPYPNLSIAQASAMTAVFGIAIPGISAIFGGILVHAEYGSELSASVLQWWSSHAIGACLVGPPIILYEKQSLLRLGQGRYLYENILTLFACLAACFLAVSFVRFPFIAIGVVLLIAAFRVGAFGASLLSVCCGLAIVAMWGLGLRPIGLEPTRAVLTLVGLPVVALLSTVLPPIAVGLGTDARREMSRALRLSERRLRDSMDRSPIGILISDLEGRWGYANFALQKMLGYSLDEFRELPPGGPSDPLDWTESRARWQRLLSGEIDFYEIDRRFQHKDGHWIWTHVAVSMARDEEGVPLHLISQIESLEARRRAEDRIAEERERLKITLQAISDAVITTDAQTRISYINTAAQAMLGLDLGAIEHRRFDEVVYLTDARTSKAAANLIGQSAIHGKVFRRETACLLHRSDGSVTYVQDAVSPVLDAAGIVTGMVIVLHDATAEFDRARDLAHRAIHDPLTGLVNRAEFKQRVQAIFGRTHYLEERPAAVMAIDLDFFKAVNDTAGHAAGDAMLRKVAEICQGNVRATDTVSRLGGDEFAIVLDNCPEERAISVARQLLAALNPVTLEWEGKPCRIGASIGLAMRSIHMATDAQWVAAADKACYSAKRAGRGQFHIAPREGDEPQERFANESF